jgi:hypothetical protein
MYKINFDELERKELKGSEKQVAWANNIRERTIQLVKEMYEELERKSPERREKLFEKMYKIRFDNFFKMMEEKSAAKWIQNNFRYASELDKILF